jgi:RHS repeat-associated protein
MTVQAPAGGGAQGYDGAGHLTSDPSGTYKYSPRGRLSSETRSGSTFSYLYNALEQRVYKSGPSAVITTGAAYYVHDEAGRLAGEYDANGAVVHETIYLGGIPVAVIVPPGTGAAAVDYVYADHLNTPRVIVRSSDHKIVWTWGSSEPFGQGAPVTGTNGLPALAYDLRFPGQVADAESGWLHNGNRDYDPGKGRYVQSDPIGLNGGIDPYAYVAGNPLSVVDPFGLDIFRNGSTYTDWWGSGSGWEQADTIGDYIVGWHPFPAPPSPPSDSGSGQGKQCTASDETPAPKPYTPDYSGYPDPNLDDRWQNFKRDWNDRRQACLDDYFMNTYGTAGGALASTYQLQNWFPQPGESSEDFWWSEYPKGVAKAGVGAGLKAIGMTGARGALFSEGLEDGGLALLPGATIAGMYASSYCNSVMASN